MTDDALDPRQRRTRRAVLAAARVVLRRDGMQAATLEAIAAEAGVARSTIYRNWADREQLLDDAIEDAAEPVPAPDPPGDDPVGRIVAVVEHLAGALQRSEWGRTLPAIVAAIDASPELADRYDRFVDGRRAEVERLIVAAVRAGALARTVVPADLVDALVGPVFYRRLVRRVDTPPAWARAHARRTLAAYGALRSGGAPKAAATSRR